MAESDPLRNVRISDELWAEVKRVAAEDGENASTLIRRLLTRYVKDHS